MVLDRSNNNANRINQLTSLNISQSSNKTLVAAL